MRRTIAAFLALACVSTVAFAAKACAQRHLTDADVSGPPPSYEHPVAPPLSGMRSTSMVRGGQITVGIGIGLTFVAGIATMLASNIRRGPPDPCWALCYDIDWPAIVGVAGFGASILTVAIGVILWLVGAAPAPAFGAATG